MKSIRESFMELFDEEEIKQALNAKGLIAPCPNCHHKHCFESVFAFMEASNTISCENCGFKLVEHLKGLAKKMSDLLRSDPKAVELFQSGKNEEFDKLLKKSFN